MRILIIEDEAIQALSLEMILRKFGFTDIRTAHVAEKAYEIISDFEPDLMLVDINLNSPVSGIEIVKKAQQNKDISVIYITGNSDSLNRGKAAETDYVEYLIKPVHPQVLESVLASIQMSN